MRNDTVAAPVLIWPAQAKGRHEGRAAGEAAAGSTSLERVPGGAGTSSSTTVVEAIFGSRTREAVLAGNRAFEHHHQFSPTASAFPFRTKVIQRFGFLRNGVKKLDKVFTAGKEGSMYELSVGDKLGLWWHSGALLTSLDMGGHMPHPESYAIDHLC